MARSQNNLTAVFTDTAKAIQDKKQSYSNKICPRDFADEIASIQTGITPSGTLDITANGNNIDVTDKASVNVNVPGYPEPVGTKDIYANGTNIDVKNYAAVNVRVEPTFESFVTTTSDYNWYYASSQDYAPENMSDGELLFGLTPYIADSALDGTAYLSLSPYIGKKTFNNTPYIDDTDWLSHLFGDTFGISGNSNYFGDLYYNILDHHWRLETTTGIYEISGDGETLWQCSPESSITFPATGSGLINWDYLGDTWAGDILFSNMEDIQQLTDEEKEEAWANLNGGQDCDSVQINYTINIYDENETLVASPYSTITIWKSTFMEGSGGEIAS